MSTTIPELVKELAEKRAALRRASLVAENSRIAFDAAHNAELQVLADYDEAEREAHNDMMTAELALRQLVTAYYEAIPGDSAERNNKKPFAGVTIAVGETVTVKYEGPKALDYCREHDLWLMVDTKKFEAAAVAGVVKADWLTIEREPKVTIRIDNDLSAVLKEATP
jgi:hypothetical protein